MNITENKLVKLAYELKVDGEIVDKATAERPLEFIFGTGMLLPDFEANVEGKVAGDKFAFTLTPEQGYGEINNEAVVELPKEIFMVDGVVADELLVVGSVLPMGDNMGNRMNGVIKDVKDDVVVMDFNHPMAGKILNFSGEIVEVREATDEDTAKFFGGSGGGCGCGCDKSECDSNDCSSDCNC